MNNKDAISGMDVDCGEDQIEQNVTRMITRIVPVLVQAIVVSAITIFVLKFAWAWVIPDLFPGAVLVGLIVPELSWALTIKLALFAAILTGINDSFHYIFSSEKQEG